MKKKTIIVTALLLMAILGGVFMLKDRFKQENKAKTIEDYQKMDVLYEKLLSIAYYYGGGMEDTYVSRTIKKDEAGQFCLIAEDRQGNRYYDMYRSYQVEDGLIKELEDYIRTYNLSAWTDLPEPEEYALDAPSTQLRMTFCDEQGKYLDSITLDYDRVFPEGGFAIVNALAEKILSPIKEEGLLDVWFSDGTEEIRVTKETAFSDEEVLKLLQGYWRDKEYNTFDLWDDQLHVYGNAYAGEYHVKEIVHETLGDCDASFYVVYESVEDENKILHVSLNKNKLIALDPSDESYRFEGE
ncbi:MAG: hypothetical protein VZR26_06800 [Erysipelotrichaceae bacterium]|nr:hypothetical protein [Erysipelotrichaceae bacterium]